jgi:hypothetical protein
MYSLENDTNRHTGVHKSIVYVLTGFLHSNKNRLLNISAKRTSFQFQCENFYCNYVRAFNWLVIEKKSFFMFERERKKFVPMVYPICNIFQVRKILISEVIIFLFFSMSFQSFIFCVCMASFQIFVCLPIVLCNQMGFYCRHKKWPWFFFHIAKLLLFS